MGNLPRPAPWAKKSPTGSNARNGWIVRWQIGQQYYDPTTGTTAHRQSHNQASPNYNPNAANNTHIPITPPTSRQIQFIKWNPQNGK